VITSIIKQFTPEESTTFKAYLRSKNKRKDIKNILLYDLLRKETPLKNIDRLLYGKPNRNAYYALSKRLQDNLIDYIATRSFQTEASEDMQVFKWILTARIFYEQNLSKPAQKILAKATKKARELDLYTALLESYHTQLQYSHLHPEINLNLLTQEARQCQEDFLKQENLNMAIAHLKRRLDFSSHLLKQPIHRILTQTLQEFNIQTDTGLTFKSLYQLLEIINTAAHLDHNYKKALPFIQSTYDIILSKNHNATKYRFYNIQILYIMANTFFRLRNSKKAMHYLNKMESEMLAEREKYRQRFLAPYLLIKSLIINYDGNAQEAIELLCTHKSKGVKNNPDLLLALTVYYTQQEEYKKALSTINKLKHSANWYENILGKDWVIKKELITLIIYYELEFIDLVQSQIRRFNRTYKSIIATEPRVKNFITVLTQLHKNPELVGEERFRESVKTQFTTIALEDEDIFMISFFAWIKAKLNRKPLYKTTLELL
jgi:hypothetical protein